MARGICSVRFAKATKCLQANQVKNVGPDARRHAIDIVP